MADEENTNTKDNGEKGIFKNPSKKMIAGLIGFLGLGITLTVAVKFGAHLYVQIILAAGVVSIPPSLIFGLAWMDAVVRGVKAWRG